MMTSYLASLSLAIRGILSNKVRASLTMLGIIIGVAAVISLMSLGKGISAMITNEIEGMGSNLVFIEPGVAEDYSATMGQGELTYEDAKAIAESPELSSSVEDVVAETASRAQVVFQDKNVNVVITGTTAASLQAWGSGISAGQYITDQDVDSRAMVCVLGSKVSGDLFEDIDPVGQVVRIDSRAFTVAGVLKSKGGLMSSDDSIFIPVTTAIYRFGTGITSSDEHNVAYIVLKVSSEDEIDTVADQVTALLHERHRISEGKEDDFTVTTQKEILDSLSIITTAMTLFLGAIASIALLVGGIGIMNIMLVSVTERTREIGIRKAVGAKRRDIMMQFLIESATLSLIGGLIGILMGWALAQLVSSVGISMGEGMKLTAAVTPDIVCLAVGVSVAIGIFFGSWPAMRAARLNPIEALRRE